MKQPSDRLRDLADAYDADRVTYGEEMAGFVLLSDLTMALDEIAWEVALLCRSGRTQAGSP